MKSSLRRIAAASIPLALFASSTLASDANTIARPVQLRVSAPLAGNFAGPFAVPSTAPPAAVKARPYSPGLPAPFGTSAATRARAPVRWASPFRRGKSLKTIRTSRDRMHRSHRATTARSLEITRRRANRSNFPRSSVRSLCTIPTHRSRTAPTPHSRTPTYAGSSSAESRIGANSPDIIRRSR